MRPIVEATVATLSQFVASTLNPTPALSVFEALGCEVDAEFEPLFNLIDSLITLITLGGLAVAVLSLTVAGLVYMFGTRDQIVRAKRRVRAVLIGLVIILSANMVVVWLVSQIGGAC
ncbi:pilin [Natronobacterium texcoconense]|uniref:TrbC/VIRB2 family protein n=1 Tax=Natronobacterium texcoconense TaxID=1095778 RepID=A0A1H1ALR2_NATTX|nr:pilin [Natronobacterium texcoconense]SDQ40592.1 hypothetical protein SAMN04489842_0736 [Natronobacterium texcoconense]